jgi:hypothetical protein
MPSKPAIPIGLTRLLSDDAQQIVGRERNRRVSDRQLVRNVVVARRVNSNVILLLVMKTPRFLIPVILSLVATPFLLFAGIASGGAGHGNYFLAKVFFPFTMLSTLIFGSIIGPFIALAVVQYPLYGLLLGAANEKRKGAIYALALAIIHLSAMVACLLLVRENFS